MKTAITPPDQWLKENHPALYYTIRALDGDRKSLRVVTVTLDASTTLVRGKKPVLLEELRPKDHVVARYLVSPTGARALSFRVADRSVRASAAPGSTAAESSKTTTAESSDAD